MNRQEISEIRRRLNPDKNSIEGIRGCYVDEKGEIISMFSHSLLTLPQEEAEKYLALSAKRSPAYRERTWWIFNFDRIRWLTASSTAC